MVIDPLPKRARASAPPPLDAWRPESAQKLAKAIETIIKATLKHGKAAGIFCGRPQDVGRWAGIGASFFIIASDTMFLGAATAAGLTESRAGLTPPTPKRRRKA